MQKLTHRVCFSLWATAHIISPPCLSYSSVSRIPSHLALHNCCHRHACVPLCGKLFLCCAMAIEKKDQGLCRLLQPTSSVRGVRDSAPHMVSASLLRCFMCLLLLLSSFSYRYRVKTVSSCLLLPGQSQKLSVTPFIHSVY